MTMVTMVMVMVVINDRGGGHGGHGGDGGGALYLRVVTYSGQPVAVRTGNQWLSNSHDDAMIECMAHKSVPRVGIA